MKASITVMAHPSRSEEARRLADTLSAEVVFDSGLGERDTARRAWLNAWSAAVCAGQEWCLVVQDDALPIEGFVDCLDKILTYNSLDKDCISLYVGTGKPFPDQVAMVVETAEQEGVSWIQGRSLYWGVGVAVRTALVPHMLRWFDRNSMRYDSSIGAFFRDSEMVPVWYTWPSLLDHADGVSLAQDGEQPSRKAWRTGRPRLGPKQAVASRILALRG